MPGGTAVGGTAMPGGPATPIALDLHLKLRGRRCDVIWLLPVEPSSDVDRLAPQLKWLGLSLALRGWWRRRGAACGRPVSRAAEGVL